MLYEEFDRTVERAMLERPDWFRDVEPPVMREQVLRIEKEIGKPIPKEYGHFATKFGAGYFGKVNISSLDDSSDWFILNRPRIEVDGNFMLVISDDESGGFYGFLEDDAGFSSKVTYIYPGEEDSFENAGASFFGFIIKYALDFSS